ncbi:MAG TPA: L,D-transpeptidase [Kofleriaceae bacterium]|nr:L,D-transpeptidase [Kofleriaceae bacterium]
MNARIVVLAGAMVVGCGSEKGGRADEPAAVAPPTSSVTEPPPVPVVPPPVPPGTRSLRLTRTVAVRLGPDEKAKRIGTIAGDTRVGWREARPGGGCKKPWFALEGQGWVCGDFIEPSTKPSGGVELPRLEVGEIVPGEYGKVIEAGTNVYTLPAPAKKARPTKEDLKAGSKTTKAAPKKPAPADVGPVTKPDPPESRQAGLVKGRPLLGSVNVRKFGELTSGGKLYWKITNRGEAEYLPATAIRQHKPSQYRGTRLGDDTGIQLPIAFVWPKGGAAKAWTRGAVKGGGNRRQVEQRTVLPILEEATDGAVTAYRVGDGEWIDASAVRVVKPGVPPPGIRADERWIDVDLDLQVLVAYEGTTPVYATMVSTGLKDTPTDVGTYRVWKKASEADMKGLSGEDPYSVSTVPWTQWFFPEEGLALHTSYWHDRFGVQKSHGCVNLSPIDARWLYFFTDPQVPPGWSMAAGVVEAPGSIVRVRNADNPNPPARGYASKIETE